MVLLALLLALSPCTKRSDCALDASTRTCGPAAEGKHGEGGPVRGAGDTCTCEAGACTLFTVEPVACSSYRQCSFSREPFLHPVSSKQVPREHKRPVRPCKDAEKDVVCDAKTKTCRLVGWSC